jgi:hypothetical protein
MAVAVHPCAVVILALQSLTFDPHFTGQLRPPLNASPSTDVNEHDCNERKRLNRFVVVGFIL